MKFPKQICIREEPEDSLLVIGDPDHLSALDAEDGDAVAIYTLTWTGAFQENPRLIGLRDKPIAAHRRRKLKR